MTDDTVKEMIATAYKAGVADGHRTFDEPGFVTWAVKESTRVGIKSIIRPPRASDLIDGLLWSRHAAYPSVASVAAAYVAHRDEDES